MRESEVNLLKSLLPYLILKWAEAQSVHGYELISLMRKRFGVYFAPSTIYSSLKKLEKEGLLTSHWEHKTKPRRVYVMTNDGRDVANALTLTMQEVVRLQGSAKPGLITLDH